MPTLTPSHRYPPKRLRPPSTCEVMGQCSICNSFFTVELYRAGRSIRARETARLKYGEDGVSLLHRPDLCKGLVTLYGSTEKLDPPSGLI